MIHFILSKIMRLFLGLLTIFSCLHASNEEQKKRWMIDDLNTLKHHLEIVYAPLEWKKEYSGLDLDQAFEEAKEEILATPALSLKQFQQILSRFCNSMQDDHLNIVFLSQEQATLPFSVMTVEGRYFIDWMDQTKMPSSFYGTQVGDELIQFGEGSPLEELLKNRKTDKKYSNGKTELSKAAKNLTIRMGAVGEDVPNGPLTIKTFSHTTGKTSTYQMLWDYQKETIKNYLDFLQSLDFLSNFFSSSKQPSFNSGFMEEELMMIDPLYGLLAAEETEHGVSGARESFVPKLGTILWKNGEENELSASDNERPYKGNYNNEEEHEADSTLVNQWNAYIYRHKNGKAIGYIRIPHYSGDQDDLTTFEETIKLLEKESDALVLDQVNNPGGAVHYLYDIASMLTTEPLETPRHSFKINQAGIVFIDRALQREKKYLSKLKNSFLEDNLHQRTLFRISFFEFLLNEWNAGRTLTKPIYLEGVDKINPHPRVNYSKPILLLINELDFSGGDFLPAILQDNQRATLFGSRTAGAGGAVNLLSFQNRSGIAYFTNTFTIAERKNREKIEDLGVVPDIEYEITVEDVISGYSLYADGVNAAIDQLLNK